MRSVSLKTVDLARLKSFETFIEIKKEKKKKIKASCNDFA